jgi:hypothetical protein
VGVRPVREIPRQIGETHDEIMAPARVLIVAVHAPIHAIMYNIQFANENVVVKPTVVGAIDINDASNLVAVSPPVGVALEGRGPPRNTPQTHNIPHTTCRTSNMTNDICVDASHRFQTFPNVCLTVAI